MPKPASAVEEGPPETWHHSEEGAEEKSSLCPVFLLGASRWPSQEPASQGAQEDAFLGPASWG